jgi:hypothetical protein
MLDPARLAAAAAEFGVAQFCGKREAWSGSAIALAAAAAVSAAASCGFAVAALLIYLIPILGAAGASLAVAGCLVALAGIALLIKHSMQRRSRQRLPVPAAQPDLQALALGAENFIRDNKALVLAGAFVAGLLISEERPRSRVCPD